MNRISRVLRPLGAIVIVALGVISMVAETPVPTPTPSSCPDLVIDVLKQPTGAMAYKWDSSGTNDHTWGTVSRPMSANGVINTEVAGFDWPLGTDIRGIWFDMFARRLSSFSTSSLGVIYVLEYTLPSHTCDLNVSWDTHLSVALPRGLCISDTQLLNDCSSTYSERAAFQLLSISDPDGSLGMENASQRVRLKSALYAALQQPPNPRDVLLINKSTASPQSIRRSFRGDFLIPAGKSAHIYVGVAAQMNNSYAKQMCLESCSNSATGNLSKGLFLIEGGTDGSIGIGMAPPNN